MSYKKITIGVANSTAMRLLLVVLSLTMGGVSSVHAAGLSSLGYATELTPIGPEGPYIEFRTETDSLGNKTKYKYNRYDLPQKILYADGSAREFKYHPKYSLPIWEKDERGVITEYEYDDNGNLTKLIEASTTADERITQYLYDSYGQLTEVKYVAAANNTDDIIIRYDYDNYGNVTKETYVAAATDSSDIDVIYSNPDVHGNYQTITDGRGNQSAVHYDAAGNIVYEADATGVATFNQYNAAGDLSRSEVGVDLLPGGNPDGSADGATIEVTDYVFNHSGETLSITDSAGVITLAYNKINALTQYKDANGATLSTAYDTFGLPSTVVDGNNNALVLQYQNADTLGSIHYGDNFTQTFAYSNRRQVRQVHTSGTGVADQTRSFLLDGANNVIKTTDAEQQDTHYQNDNLNRIQTSTSPIGQTTFVYDDDDNLLSVTDPAGKLTSFSYNQFGDVLTETKDGKSRSYEWDNNGNLASVINAKNEKTLYQYDTADRLAHEWVYVSAAAAGDTDIPERHIWHRYDSYGRYNGYRDFTASPANRATWVDTDNTYTYETLLTYNDLSQVISVTQDIDGAGANAALSKTYHYTYYPNGLKKTYTTPSPESNTYTYHYDNNNQLTAVDIPGEGQISYSDFKWHQPQQVTLPGNNKIVPVYDNYFRLKEWRLVDAAGNPLAHAENYGYDLENNITGFHTDQGQYDFDYDNGYRLTDWQRTESDDNRAVTYQYDGVGNRLSDSEATGATANWNYGAVNELNIIPGLASFTYDANGHMVYRKGSDPRALDPYADPDAVTVYRYDARERLTEIYHGADGVGCLSDADTSDCVATSTYQYNPFGQRIQKDPDTVTAADEIYYLYNDEGLAAEYDSSGNLIKEYHFKPGQTWMTEPLFMRNGDGTNHGDGVVYFYQNDHLGTPQAIVARNGALVWQAQYEAFGKATILIQTVANNLRFPGQYYDAESGLHHNYYRDYDPIQGRYVQSDPIGLAGGLNYYLYANGGPLVYTDPTGEVVPLFIVGAQMYARCFVGCMAAEGLKEIAKKLLGGECTTNDLGDKAAEAAKGCAKDCLNPLNWGPRGFKRGPKNNIDKDGPNVKKSANANSKAKRRAAREAQRQHGTPTSRPGRNHQDRAPGSPRHQTKEGADGTLDGIVDGSRDTVPGHGPHMEAGKLKANKPFNKHNQPRLRNGKSKVEY